MPPKIKSKTAPNQHDKRHESGLAAPGKRVTKQRSNGQLNGQPNGKAQSQSATAPPALPTTGLNSGYRFPRPVGALAEHSSTAAASQDHATEPDANLTARDRTSSEASVEQEGGDTVDMADLEQEPAATGSHPANATAHACKPHAPATSRSTLNTILVNYPLRDAISILIVLLSLPPALVLVIQMLFASLTFVPPTAGISLSTLPNIKEMFNANNFGYPAMATIIIVDLLFWLCWLPLWKSLQACILDFSQVVVAVSLSGAAASDGGPKYSIAACAIIVGVVHVVRQQAFHVTALVYLRTVLLQLDINIPLEFPQLSSPLFYPESIEHGWFFTSLQNTLGIHIVSQGIITIVRQFILRANERDQGVPAIIKTDTEATAGSDPFSRAAAAHAEASGVTPNADARSNSISSTGPRDVKSRELNNKKKKKQANQVRSQQPLWAAIASTKVTFVKEMEQRDAADDARDSASIHDRKPSSSVNSTRTDSTDKLWIAEVRDTEILFSLDLSSESSKESSDQMEEGVSVSAGIDKSKPFYVRVNGASWTSTRIMSSATGEQSENKDGGCYDGEIYGLAPLSSYHCEIIGMGSGTVLCSAGVITQVATSDDQTAAATVPQQHPALRPSSPITTLRNSILSAEAKLNETRNRTRKSKKDQRGAHADIRKEINALKSKLESSGGLDDKQERRLMQINQHKTQAEEATADFKSQIEALGEIPSGEIAASETTRGTWQSALDAKEAATRDMENAKAEADREIANLKAEVTATESKREKLSARKVQRAQELEKLAAKQQSDKSAKQKREHDRAQVLRNREIEEKKVTYMIVNMENEINSVQQKTQDAYHQIAALQSWGNPPPAAYPVYSSPPTPEGLLPGTNGTSNGHVNGLSTFNAQANFIPTFGHAQSPASGHKQGMRGRSSSMLSQYSGFTEDGEDDHVGAMPQTQGWAMNPQAGAGATNSDDRKDSDGSTNSYTNGSTGSNSPRPDAKPFSPARMSPIAPPSKVRQSPAQVNSSLSR